MYRQLETERLRIRPIALTDGEFIYQLVNTPGWLKFIGDRNVRSSSDAESYIRKILANKNYYYSVFELKNTKEAIGIITFLYRDNQKFPDIGFAMLDGYGKKGYAFEACRKYLDEIIRENIASKIIAITLPENSNSVKLIEKLGLKYESDFTDNAEVLQLYALIPSASNNTSVITN